MEPKAAVGPRLREKSLGRYGEDVAARYLQDAGLVLIDRNWRGRSGEVDLVALDGAILVICEVKTRTSDQFGGPLAADGARENVLCRGDGCAGTHR